MAMAPEEQQQPQGFREAVARWPRLTPEQRAALARRLVARSRAGDPVTGEMLQLLALLREGGKGATAATPGR